MEPDDVVKFVPVQLPIKGKSNLIVRVAEHLIFNNKQDAFDEMKSDTKRYSGYKVYKTVDNQFIVYNFFIRDLGNYR